MILILAGNSAKER